MDSETAIPISCRLEMLPGERVDGQIEAAQRFGFDGIALPGRFLERWIQPLRDCFQDSPLPMVSLSLGFKHSLISPHDSERRECQDSLMRLLDICAEFKVRHLNMPPCLIQDNPERIRDKGRYASIEARLDDLLLKQLPALGNAAEERNVQLLIEPVNQYESEYLNSIVHAARLCGKLNHPAIGCTADFFHMQLEELHADAAIHQALSWIRHVHVAENTRVEPGPGSLDFTPGFRELKQNDYRGWMEVECRRLSGPAGEVLPKSVEYLSSLWLNA